MHPSLALIVGFQVVRRTTDYFAARPARELCFVVVDREEKYAAKSFIDTFVYRGGDALGAGAFGLVGARWRRGALPLCRCGSASLSSSASSAPAGDASERSASLDERLAASAPPTRGSQLLLASSPTAMKKLSSSLRTRRGSLRASVLVLCRSEPAGTANSR